MEKYKESPMTTTDHANRLPTADPQTTETLSNGQVSYRQPDGLILSTGNLYFTSHDANYGTVWRIAQDAVAGQEILLYAELGARFGDIVFAQVNGTFYGYFFARQAAERLVRIKRVPLTGGAATTLATLPGDVDIASSHHNLVTDGSYLYWQDDTAVRQMPIGGGTITELAATTPQTTPTAGVYLLGDRLIYASGNEIRSVSTAGTSVGPRPISITGPDRVTAIFPRVDGVYWGDQSGVLRFEQAGVVSTISAPAAVTGAVTSIGLAPQALVWSQAGGSAAFIVFNVSVNQWFQPAGSDPLGIAVTTQGTEHVFWGDSQGVHRWPA
jgi:hypothetical protein